MHGLRPRHRECVVTIGNFDGVHLGHRAVLEQLAALGREARLPTTLVTFEPQPQEFFAGPNAPARLTRFREKMTALAETPLERVVVLRFDQALSRTSAETFVEEFLLDGLGMRDIVAGEDFRFGRDGYGNLMLLEEYGARHGFRVVKRETFHVAGGRVSSSWVRDALANGELELAAELLGRPYRMCGRVRRGDRIGRTLGYPTANIDPERLVCPLGGIYVVTVSGLEPRPLPGVASVGTRPTLDGTRTVIEAHLFDFDRDIYGRRVEVHFLHKLRDELRFDSLEALRAQIDRDADRARSYFAH